MTSCDLSRSSEIVSDAMNSKGPCGETDSSSCDTLVNNDSLPIHADVDGNIPLSSPDDTIANLIPRFNKTLMCMSLKHKKETLTLSNQISLLKKSNKLLENEIIIYKERIFSQDRQIRHYQDDLESMVHVSTMNDIELRRDTSESEMEVRELRQLCKGYEAQISDLQHQVNRFSASEKKWIQRERIMAQESLEMRTISVVMDNEDKIKKGDHITRGPISPSGYLTRPRERKVSTMIAEGQLDEVKSQLKYMDMLKEAILAMEMITDHHVEVKEITSRLRRKNLIGPHLRANEFLGGAEKAWLDSLRKCPQDQDHQHNLSHSHSRSRPASPATPLGTPTRIPIYPHKRTTSITSIDSISSSISGRQSPITSTRSLDTSQTVATATSRRSNGSRSPVNPMINRQGFTMGTFKDIRMTWELRDNLTRLQSEHKLALEQIQRLEEERSAMILNGNVNGSSRDIDDDITFYIDKKKEKKMLQEQLERMEERRLLEREYFEYRIKEMESILEIGDARGWTIERQALEEKIAEQATLIEVYKCAWTKMQEGLKTKSTEFSSSVSLPCEQGQEQEQEQVISSPICVDSPLLERIQSLEKQLATKSAALETLENELSSAKTRAESLTLDLAYLTKVYEKHRHKWQMERAILTRHSSIPTSVSPSLTTSGLTSESIAGFGFGTKSADESERNRKLILALLRTQMELERIRSMSGTKGTFVNPSEKVNMDELHRELDRVKVEKHQLETRVKVLLDLVQERDNSSKISE